MNFERDIGELTARVNELERRAERLENQELWAAIQLVQVQLETLAKELGGVRNINVWMLRSFVGAIITLFVTMLVFFITNPGGTP